MMGWLLKQFLKRYMVRSHPFMFVDFYGTNW